MEKPMTCARFEACLGPHDAEEHGKGDHDDGEGERVAHTFPEGLLSAGLLGHGEGLSQRPGSG
jgi:hypothetical protein